jgi:superfamily II DNA or RNA helicase
MNLRPYQQAALDAVESGWFDHARQLVVLPTGCGKTILFSKLAQLEASRGNRVLILAHRDELIRQAADKLAKSTGLPCAVEKADETAEGSEHLVTVGSVQTLMREKRLARFTPDHWQLIVIDEAHRALSAGYRAILDHFTGARLLGVTATPDRADKRNLGEVFQRIAYEYSLRKAIAEGYLVPIKAQTMPLKLDVSGVKIMAGDFAAEDLGDVLAPHLEEIAGLIAEHAGNRKTLIFLPLVATSKAMTDACIAAGLDCRHVDGTSPDRRELLDWFATPGPKVLCNSMLLTEGYDQPDVSCVVVLRPTKSRPLYAQMVGRGTRLAEGKANLLVLDFLWHSERHALCRPVHLVAKSDEVAEAAAKIADAAGGPMDLELLEEAASDEVRKEREASLAARLKENARKKARLIDPLAFALSLHDEDLETYEPTMPWEMAPPSEKQLAAIDRMGLDSAGVQNAGFASMLLDRVMGRIHEGLSSPKQIRLLAKYGVDASGLTMERCTAMINAIAAMNWRRPSGAPESW